MDNPKIAMLTAFSVGGILLPVFIPVARPLALISLGTATGCSWALSQETKYASFEGAIIKSRRENRIEAILTAEEYRHAAELSRLESLYFSPIPTPALPGAHPAQPALPQQDQDGDFYIPLPTPAIQPPSDTALSKIVASPYESRFIAGAQRSGKSLLAAVVSRRLQESRGTQIFHINLASVGDEDRHYWENARISVTGNLTTCSPNQVPHLLGKAIECVDLFLQTPESLLIVDEWTILCSLFNPHIKMVSQLTKRLAGIISGLASSGRKQRRALWALAPELVATNLSQEGKSVKSLRLCYVSANPSATVEWQGDPVEFSIELFRQLKANYDGVEMPPLMQGDRIVQINGVWYPIGVKSTADLKASPPVRDDRSI